LGKSVVVEVCGERKRVVSGDVKNFGGIDSHAGDEPTSTGRTSAHDFEYQKNKEDAMN
jgi:hypothetical protein